MTVPDFISPITAYRAWQWNANGAEVPQRRAMACPVSRLRRPAGPMNRLHRGSFQSHTQSCRIAVLQLHLRRLRREDN